ncbi:hypothetical protein NC652_001904 [Populus alba x Populus x berolinensis]|nr:hypothetical protein NC652_001904 [Populus alba x Populus x berolinensis]
MDAPSQQEMSYYDHVKRRHGDKGCLYALSITRPRNGSSMKMKVIPYIFHVP